MITVDDLEIPGDVQTLQGFRSWVATLDEYAPRVSFYRGEVHIEVSPQNHRTHGPVAGEINRVLAGLARELAIGMYWTSSPIFGRSFRLERFANQAGWVEFRLEVTGGSTQPSA